MWGLGCCLLIAICLTGSACSVSSGQTPGSVHGQGTGDGARKPEITLPLGAESRLFQNLTESSGANGPVKHCYPPTVALREGEIRDPGLNEISGIVASRHHAGVLWMHNDSGDGATLYAVNTEGELLSRHDLFGVVAFDWEDIGIGPGPVSGVDYLYAGDIGDNLLFRSEVVAYRVPEPEVGRDTAIFQLETISLVYPTPGQDAEALAVDPLTGDLFVVTKTTAERPGVYRAPAERLGGEGSIALELVATLALPAGGEVTAADFSPNGDRFALRSYRHVWIWDRTSEDMAETLAAVPCAAASPEERQGEALAFSADGRDMFTVSEGSDVVINRITASEGAR